MKTRSSLAAGFTHCGSFKSGYVIDVYARRTTCATAFRIQREYWDGKRADKVILNGGGGAFGYVLLPGWKRMSGAGGGQCAKGTAIAAYQN